MKTTSPGGLAETTPLGPTVRSVVFCGIPTSDSRRFDVCAMTPEGDGAAATVVTSGAAPAQPSGPPVVQALMAVAGFAGVLAFLYFLGGVILWLRLRVLHVPTDLSLSFVPREYLVVVAMRKVILPVAVAGLLGTVAYLWVHKISNSSRKVWSVVLTVLLLGAALVVASVGAMFVVPMSRSGYLWFGVFVATCFVYLWVAIRSRSPEHAFPASRLVVIVVLLASTAVVLSEVFRPALLPRAMVVTSEGQTVTGDYVGRSSDSIFLAIESGQSVPPGAAVLAASASDTKRQVIALARSSVKSLTIEEATRDDQKSTFFARLRASEIDRAEVYVMDADGRNPRRLTDNLTFDGDPSWTPDASMVVFSAERDGNVEIYIAKADGSAERRITRDSGFDGVPSVGRDGRIIFATERFGSVDIAAMNLDGTGVRQLTDDSADDWIPAVGPDGRIAFVSERDGNSNIYVMDGNGEGERPLTSDPGDERDPSWSPDGRSIVFTKVTGAGSEVWKMDADGQNQALIVSNGATPSWGKDGRIVFQRGRSIYSDVTSDDAQIYATDSDGQSEVQLTFDGSPSEVAVWSPDGLRIAFRRPAARQLFG